MASRVEARIAVPTGGAAVSATVANGGSAVTCTIPAANYFLTAAGGVSSLLTTLQTQLNNNSQGYPQTAAAMAAAVGYGTWSSGWLFNIASGNDTGAFGGVTLTASGITYGTAGPRGGIDKAIGFDGAADQLTGGDTFDVTSTEDLCLAWVGYFSAGSVTEFLFAKGDSGATRWGIYIDAGSLVFECLSASGTKSCSLAYPVAEWHVGIATIDRSTGKIRIGVRTLNTLTTTVSTETTAFAETHANAHNFTVGNRNALLGAQHWLCAAAYIGTGVGAATGLSANLSTALTNWAAAVNASWAVSMSTTTGLVSISWTGYATPTWSLSWTSTDLRDALGFTANISAVTTTQTGTEQAQGVWFPGCPINLEGDPTVAPRVTDTRYTQSPTGFVLGLSGNSFYRHRGVVWSHVARSQVWETAATYVNGSYETFAKDVFYGMGHAWFTPAAPVQIYWTDAGTDRALGYTFNSSAGVPGWSVINVASTEPRKAAGDWTGLWRIEFGDVIAEGS